MGLVAASQEQNKVYSQMQQQIDMIRDLSERAAIRYATPCKAYQTLNYEPFSPMKVPAHAAPGPTSLWRRRCDEQSFKLAHSSRQAHAWQSSKRKASHEDDDGDAAPIAKH
jgi:hypothetical protein